MSDHAEIGYMDDNAAEACYKEAARCQLAVLIVGKRYNKGKDGLSVTHKEFHAIQRAKLPLITLVDRDIIAVKDVFEWNLSKGVTTEVPGMEEPSATFGLISEINRSEVRNGIIPYSTTIEACGRLKKQIALLVGDILEDRRGATASTIKDVLSEVQALRLELSKGKGEVAAAYAKILRAFLEPENEFYENVITHLFPDVEPALKAIYEGKEFDELLTQSGKSLLIDDSLILRTLHGDQPEGAEVSSASLIRPRNAADDDEELEVCGYVLFGDSVVMSKAAHAELLAIHRAIDEVLRPPEPKIRRFLTRV